MSSNMQITVLDVKGKDITLAVDPDDLVKDIKEKIEAQMNIASYLQKLTFCGKVLKYKRTLKSYNIGTGAALQFSPNNLLSVNGLELEKDPNNEKVSKPGVDWSSLAARGKAKVDKDIERRKEQYNSLLEVKVGVLQKARALEEEMWNDWIGLKSDSNKIRNEDKKMASLSDDIEKLQEAIKRKQLEICETEREQQILINKREEDKAKFIEKHSRLDVFKTEMKHLDEDMKQALASDEEFHDQLKKANGFMKDFLLESISAKKSLLECPVCFETASPPIHKCPKEHLICSKCLPKMNQKCPTCRIDIQKSTDSIFRLAEENYSELQKLLSGFKNLSIQSDQ